MTDLFLTIADRMSEVYTYLAFILGLILPREM